MIRSFEERDLDDLLRVWMAASRLAHPFLDDAFLERERTEIAETHIPNAETWVFERDGRVVGFVAMLGNEVGGLFVDPEQHRRGIGRALLDHVCATRPTLELDVFERNGLGRAFYEAYGFRKVGSHLHEATGQVELRMRWGR